MLPYMVVLGTGTKFSIVDILPLTQIKVKTSSATYLMCIIIYNLCINIIKRHCNKDYYLGNNLIFKLTVQNSIERSLNPGFTVYCSINTVNLRQSALGWFNSTSEFLQIVICVRARLNQVDSNRHTLFPTPLKRIWLNKNYFFIL